MQDNPSTTPLTATRPQRRCHCGTILSRYNRGFRCWVHELSIYAERSAPPQIRGWGGYSLDDADDVPHLVLELVRRLAVEVAAR